ncbi:MAG: endonuclease/exonuclease/phosphatase family protein [Planctomycetes bacterium]|nr:endonuclease/exonuclease/phosphatase family protein [Planctomycetota bacterium]
MRRSSLLTTVTLLALTACSTPVEFRALTANLRYGTAKDGDNAWPVRRELLAATIVTAAPTVLGVQEALDFQLEFLAERLPHHRRLGQGRDGGDRGEHAALFVDETAFEVVEHGDFWLSLTPDTPASVGWDAALPRICTWAHLRGRASGRELRVWNLHLDHRGSEARRESARLVAARIAELPGPHLVLGDLNAGETSPPLVALREAGLRDTFRTLHPDAAAVGTFHGFRGGTAGDKIDYVLATREFEVVDAAILSEPGPGGRHPSDHHFVVATLRL